MASPGCESDVGGEFAEGRAMHVRLPRIAATLGVASAVLFHVVAAQAAEPGGEPGFVSLFNGRDLTGWVNVNCAPETFTVQEGMIHCDGVPTGALRSVKQYENFELELEWRHLKPGGNAGIFIWAGPLPALGQPFLRAIEVQVLDTAYGESDWYTTHGDVFPIHGSVMTPFTPNRGQRSFPKEKRSRPAPEWNHYRIVGSNGVLRLSVNGAEVSGGTECNWRKGYIAIESEGGVADYRNLRIRELPSTGATPEQTAPLAEPWRLLYDGRSLRGWTGTESAMKAWKPSDWNLRVDASAPAEARLWSTAILGDFDAFLDFKWPEKAPALAARQMVRLAGEGHAEAGALVALVPLNPETELKTNTWHRLEFSRRGDRVVSRVDGAIAGEATVPTGKLQLGLQPSGVVTHLSSLFVKETP